MLVFNIYRINLRDLKNENKSGHIFELLRILKIRWSVQYYGRRKYIKNWYLIACQSQLFLLVQWKKNYAFRSKIF